MIRGTLKFSSETIRAEREWSKIFTVLKEKKQNHQLRILYFVKLSSKDEGGIKTFSGKQKMGKLFGRKPTF